MFSGDIDMVSQLQKNAQLSHCFPFKNFRRIISRVENLSPKIQGQKNTHLGPQALQNQALSGLIKARERPRTKERRGERKKKKKKRIRENRDKQRKPEDHFSFLPVLHFI